MQETLEVRVRHEGKVGVLECEGYINNMGGEKVAEVCYGLIDEGIKHFILNLAKVRIINSIGISILIEIIEKLKELDGGVVFCCAEPTIAKTFRIMGLLKTASLHETEEEALKEVGDAAG
jgi:anti-sigma B factor antagonist